MNARTVLVTRPEPGASQTARRLEAAGFAPILLPLTETVALPVVALPEAADFDAVAITSARAIVHAPRALVAGLAGVKCHAVGARTGAAASEAGLSVTRADAGDARALARQIAETDGMDGRILYLCGRVRRPDFEEALGKAGLHVTAIETYDTRAIDRGDDEVGEAIVWNPVWGAAVYSAGGAELLAGLVARPRLAPLFAATRYFCLSSRIAAALGEAAGKNSIVAGEPNEASLLREMAGA